jgi:hypothetical protein
MAIAMFSGEKEKVMMDGEVRYLVELPHPCPHRGRRLVVITSLNVPMQVSCDGAVESWLQNVVDGMRAALSKEFRESVVAYDEKPRAKWLFDQCAQITVIVTRVFYTQEMNESFDQLEEGNDNALKDFWQKQCNFLLVSDCHSVEFRPLSGSDMYSLSRLCTHFCG